MSKNAVGLGFCFIGALLFSARYITAALFHMGYNDYSNKGFNLMLDAVGQPILYLSIFALIVGVVYLYFGWKEN